MQLAWEPRSTVMTNHSAQEVGQYLAQQGIAGRVGHHCAQPTMQRYGIAATVRSLID
ncbi:MAG: aminotransferase class V-fold PLP-dependent enzyme [Coleofasciculus sp. S288]|nr:aminotransferase class V-fold PLP-dependent enzyme [Coleofasciculus sp. S288]